MPVIKSHKRNPVPKVKKHNRRCTDCGELCWPNSFRCQECFADLNNRYHDHIYEADADHSHSLEARHA